MPPPTTRSRFGISFSSSAPVESITRGSSWGKPGISTGREPAAMIAWSNDTVVVPLPFATLSSLGPEKLPTPWTTCTLRCLARPARPPVSLPTTVFFQAASFSSSIFGSPKTTPLALISLASSMTLAAWSSAFDGMQPTLRQTPPKAP